MGSAAANRAMTSLHRIYVSSFHLHWPRYSVQLCLKFLGVSSSRAPTLFLILDLYEKQTTWEMTTFTLKSSRKNLVKTSKRRLNKHPQTLHSSLVNCGCFSTNVAPKLRSKLLAYIAMRSFIVLSLSSWQSFRQWSLLLLKATGCTLEKRN